MEILATHVAADFDGLAAMIAARRFHPEARLFFPGSKEGSDLQMRGGIVDPARKIGSGSPCQLIERLNCTTVPESTTPSGQARPEGYPRRMR